MGASMDRLRADQRRYHALYAGKLRELVASGIEEQVAKEQAEAFAKEQVKALQAKRRAGTNRGRKVLSS